VIRRAALAALALTVVGGVATPALAEGLSSSLQNHVVCVSGNNSSSGAHDGVCVWFPSGL
jgi:hypothetical protein